MAPNDLSKRSLIRPWVRSGLRKLLKAGRELPMAISEINGAQLVLVLARQSRGAGHWDKDDFDVKLGDKNGPVIGRIMRHPHAPKTQPWFWKITAREQPPSVYNRGLAASREQAIRYFKARYVPKLAAYR